MSELRSRTIRLAYTNLEVRPYLVELLATDRVAYEFSTEEALDKYLKNHPNADKSKHRVKGDEILDKHTHTPKQSLLNKMRGHVQHILFDDFQDAWSESKAAYHDIVAAVKSRKNRRAVAEALESASTGTKTFF